MSAQIITTQQVCERFGKCSSRTIHRWRKQLGFPDPIVSYRGGASRYRLQDIEQWEQSRAMDKAR